MMILRSLPRAAALAALAPAALAAQTLAGSARAAGMADAYGAVARGAVAGFYNPANLGLPGNPGFSLQLAAAQVAFGAAPITLADVNAYAGRVVPADVKQRWLDRIPAGGSLRTNVGTNVSGLALSAGPIAVATGVVGEAQLALPRSAVELFLFGNGGASGTPQDFTLTNGAGHGFAVGFTSVSLGLPILRRGTGAAQRALALGVTGKYLAAGAMAQLWDAGGRIGADPITADLRFPAFTLYDDARRFSSNGLGLDVGVAYRAPRFSLGLSVSDAVNTFAWDTLAIRVRDGRAFLSVDSTTGSFDEATLWAPTVPAALRDSVRARVADAVFQPSFRASAAWQASRRLLVAADVLRRTGTARSLQAAIRTSANVGIEFRPLGLLPLRAGGALFDGGYGWTVGTGLELGLVNVNAAYGRRGGDFADQTVSVGVGFGRGR